MKNKCCLIIPYFGKFPEYFNLFLKSCEYNPDYTWIIFTDDSTLYNYPVNVIKYTMSLSELKQLFEKKFCFKISLDTPHKLCDFKPAYGYVFEDYIKEYAFWGHCDVDVIFGNLNNFINDELLEMYDKLFCLGHFILYRNSHDNNRTFMLPVEGEYWFKESFSTTKTTIFDETYGGSKNVNTIFLEYGKRVFMADWSMNCKIAPNNLVKTTYNAETNQYDLEKGIDAVYVWENGHILRYYLKKTQLVCDEFMYIHLQARKMKMRQNLIENTTFKILGNQFTDLEVDTITKENFKKIKRKVISLRAVKLQIAWKSHRIRREIKKIFYIRNEG